MMIQVSFRRIGRSLKARMRLPFRGVLVPDDRPQPEQLRTDPGPRPFGSAQVDPETHLVVLGVKADDAALFGKGVESAARQHIPLRRRGQPFDRFAEQGGVISFYTENN